MSISHFAHEDRWLTVAKSSHVEDPRRALQAAEPEGAEKQRLEAFVFIIR